MSKTWYGHHIENIKGDDYVLFKDYLELDKEIERLKAREQEYIDKYLVESKYRSEIEGKYVLAKYVIDELEKWLEERRTYYCMGCSNIYEDSLGKTRLVNEDIFNEITKIKDRLKELKEGK